MVQLNVYETAPYCLLNFEFLPEFTCYEPKIVQNINFRFTSGKFRQKLRNQQTIDCHVLA